MGQPRQPHKRADPPSPRAWESHERMLGQVGAQQQATAGQIATLTEQVSHVTEQVSKLVTAVEVMQNEQSNHNKVMSDLKSRMDGYEERERERAAAVANVQLTTQNQIAATQMTTQTQVTTNRIEMDSRFIGILWGLLSGAGLLVFSYILMHLPK